MRTLPQDDELLAALLAQHQPRKGCLGHMWDAFFATLVVGVCLIAIVVGWEHLSGAPVAPSSATTPGSQNRVTGNGSQSTENGYRQQQQPIAAPAPAPQLPDCASVQDTTTACEQNFVSNTDEVSPTPTALPTPTATGFWSAEDIAAWTATAEAYYNPETLPTAPPAFVQAVEEGCQDPTKVAQSKLLASWCGGGDE